MSSRKQYLLIRKTVVRILEGPREAGEAGWLSQMMTNSLPSSAKQRRPALRHSRLAHQHHRRSLRLFLRVFSGHICAASVCTRR